LNKLVKIIPLGGLGEIGKNLTVFETEKDIIIVDCGMSFPEGDDMLGVEIVLPDMTYLELNKDKIRGIFITHAHEDHIGGIPFLLKKINVPVFGTRLTLGVLENKLSEHKLKGKTKCQLIKSGSTIKMGDFELEFIKVNHSIPGAVAIAMRTPAGIFIHTGDWKIDLTPVNGDVMDLTRFGEYGKEGVKLLMCDSTNAERSGFTRSEKDVANSLNELFSKYSHKRITVATFSSNIYRVQSVVAAALKHKRKIAITGKSMLNITDVAMELGYIKIPEKSLIDIEEVNDYPANKVVIITTGSQGEPMSALYRMAFSEHKIVSFDQDDVIILSSHTIPGNEKLVNAVVNQIAEKGITIVQDNSATVHVSGHACEEELKILHSLVKPEYFMPVHGEMKHLLAHKNIAMKMGMKEENIIIAKNGKVVEVSEEEVKITSEVPSGQVLIDGGSTMSNVGSVVLKDRKVLSQDGMIMIVTTIDLHHKYILTGPDIVSRGFVYVKEADELIAKIREISRKELQNCLDRGITDWGEIKGKTRDAVSKYVYNKTRRNPMILPIIESI
jgi:ribonuclease J